MNNQPLEGGSSISEGTISKEILEDSDQDFLFGVLGVVCFFSTGGGKARFKLDTDGVLEGGLYNM